MCMTARNWIAEGVSRTIHTRIVEEEAARDMRTSAAVSVGEAAKEFGVSTGTVRNWIDKGYLQAVRFPSGHRRISEAEINRMLTQLFHVAEPSEETETRRVVAVPLEDDEWGPAV
jgi:excisionase family DNA binding protein